MNVFDIAREIVSVGFDPVSPAESSLVCPLRLQKLLYYAQGWSLALLDTPLFHENIEAWAKGPAVYDVYDQFRGKVDPIHPNQLPGSGRRPSTDELQLIGMVWSIYAPFTPSQLIARTHSETPWQLARWGTPPDAFSRNVITLDSLKEFFIREARRLNPPGLPDPVADWKVRIGDATPARDFFEGLLSST